MSRTYKWDDNSDKLDKSLEIVSIEDIGSVLKDNGLSVYGTPRHTVDDIYIRHPYINNAFIKADRDPVDLFCDKFYAISDVLQYLGVTKISAKIELKNSQKREFDANINCGFKKLINGELDIKSQNEQYRQRSANLLREYEKPQISYEKALAKAEENGTISEPKIKSLIEQRGCNEGGSTLKTDCIEVDITDNMNQSLDIAFSLKFMSIFRLSASYSEALETCNEIDFKINIEF